MCTKFKPDVLKKRAVLKVSQAVDARDILLRIMFPPQSHDIGCKHHSFMLIVVYH